MDDFPADRPKCRPNWFNIFMDLMLVVVDKIEYIL